VFKRFFGRRRCENRPDWRTDCVDVGKTGDLYVLSAGEKPHTQRFFEVITWVATFREGNAENFDWGYDYSECGAVKLFRSLGAAELAPYMCLNDFVSSTAMGTGLVRTTNLAKGYDRFYFRYKQKRPVLQDWSTEIPRIRSRMKAGIIRNT
jgi:hypothetical protein